MVHCLQLIVSFQTKETILLSSLIQKGKQKLRIKHLYFEK